MKKGSTFPKHVAFFVLVLSVTILPSILLSQELVPYDCLDPCHEDATFDGANCFIGEVPESSEPFVLDNEIYYQPIQDSETPCPIGELFYDQCFFYDVPITAVAFVDNGKLFHTNRCLDPAEWTPWTRLDTPEGYLIARAGHRRIHLTWVHRDPENRKFDYTVVSYGQAGAREQLFEKFMPSLLQESVLPWITRKSCMFGRFFRDKMSGKSLEHMNPSPDICKNGGLLYSSDPHQAWLRDLRIDLAYRVEVQLYYESDSEPFVFGPIFLTTR